MCLVKICFLGCQQLLKIGNLLNCIKPFNRLKDILDRSGDREYWRKLYEELNKGNILTIKEYVLDAISNNCNWKLGKNILQIMCIRDVEVDKVLKFAKVENRSDIFKILEAHCDKKITDLNYEIKQNLTARFGIMGPLLRSHWKILFLTYLKFNPDCVKEIETGSFEIDTKSPTEKLIEIISVQNPDYSSNDLAKHLRNIGIRNGAGEIHKTIFEIGKGFL